MADSIVENCGNCRYYLNSGHVIGTCRRFPIFQNRSVPEWCGEYAAKIVEKQLSNDELNIQFGKLYDQIDEQRKIDAAIIAEDEIEVTVKRGRKPKGKA